MAPIFWCVLYPHRITLLSLGGVNVFRGSLRLREGLPPLATPFRTLVAVRSVSFRFYWSILFVQELLLSLLIWSLVRGPLLRASRRLLFRGGFLHFYSPPLLSLISMTGGTDSTSTFCLAMKFV